MNEPDTAPDAVRRRRLLYRATHRGTQETDLLVGGFVAAHISGMAEDELATLEAVLELPDVDLADWLTGRRPLPGANEFRAPAALGGQGEGSTPLLRSAPATSSPTPLVQGQEGLLGSDIVALLRRMKDAAP